MNPTFKAGDVVVCKTVGGNFHITKNKQYTVVRCVPDDNIIIKNNLLIDTSYQAFRFELVNIPTDLVSQITLAQSFLGKTIIYDGIESHKYKCDRMKTYLHESHLAQDCSLNAKRMFKKFGFAVVVGDVSNEFDVCKVSLAPSCTELVLNSSYTAEIYADKVVVGCQTFSKEMITKVYEEMMKLSS